MTAFEIMDPKMDMRLKRNDFKHSSNAIEEGILVTERDLNQDELVALFNEFFVQISTWQHKNVTVQQTIYSCYYLVRREYCDRNPLLKCYVEALHHLVFAFYSATRTSYVLRDEDIAFPPVIARVHQVEIRELVAKINEHLSVLFQGKQDPQTELLFAHLTFIKSFSLLGLNVFCKEALALGKEQEKGGKKKKKKANPMTDVGSLLKKMATSLESISKALET